MRRLLIIALSLLVCSCAGSADHTSVADVDIVGVERVEIAGDEPAQITLRIAVSNDERRFSVREARLRVGIGIRRSVALTLAEPVIVKRGESVVEVPIKITIAHNSRTVALRKALRDKELSLLEFDGEVRLRRGIGSRRMTFSSSELKQALTDRLLDELWQIIDENITEEQI